MYIYICSMLCMTSYGGESNRFIMWLKWISTKTTTNQWKFRFFFSSEIYGMIEAGAHTFMPRKHLYLQIANHCEEYVVSYILYSACFQLQLLFSYWFCCVFFFFFILERALRSLNKHLFRAYLYTFALTANCQPKFESIAYTYAKCK